MTTPAPFTLPPVAAIYGASVHLHMICKSWPSVLSPLLSVASFDVAADNAAAAVVSETTGTGQWPDREGLQQTPERQRARAELHVYFLERSPDIVLGTFWGCVEYMLSRPLPRTDKPLERAALVVPLRTTAEFELLRQRAPWAIAIGVAGIHDTTGANTDRPEIAETIASEPLQLSWLSNSSNRRDYVQSWRRLMVERIHSLACSAYDQHANHRPF